MSKYHRLIKRVVRKTAGTVTRVITQEPIVAFTFDDGPDPAYTSDLLEILDQYKALATFFMVGNRAKRHRDLVRQVAEAGHAIGNHTWDHPSLPQLSRQERITQMKACEQALAPYGQRLLRPPHGHLTLTAHLEARLLGYRIITWNVSANDWMDHDADWLVARVKSAISPGSIVLFHDSLYHAIDRRYANRQPTLSAVKLLLQAFSQSFQFVTVPELLQRGTAVEKAWQRTGDANWLGSLQDMEKHAQAHSEQEDIVKKEAPRKTVE